MTVLLDALERMDDEAETPERSVLATSMIVRLEDRDAVTFAVQEFDEAALLFEALYEMPSEPAVDALVQRVINSVEYPHKLLSTKYLRDNSAMLIG